MIFFFSFRKTLVVMDSRGRRIQAGMENSSIICKSYSGATLRSIRLRVESLIIRHRPVTCLILVGVNDLTLYDRITRTVTLAKYDPFDLANSIIARVLSLRKHLIIRFPNTKIIFGGINGIDIAQFNKDEFNASIQSTIDDCITQVNAYLRLLNRVHGWYHPRFTSKVHIWRSARRVNRYHLLPDGLHLGGIVCQSWITAIYRTHRISTLGLAC